MNLWALAVRLSPCRSAAYISFRNADPTTLSEAAKRAAIKESMLYFDHEFPEVSKHELIDSLKFRAELRRTRARYLLEKGLPRIVLHALQSGRYEVTARLSGQRVAIEPAELACLYPDLNANSLIAGSTIFEMIVITEKEHSSIMDKAQESLENIKLSQPIRTSENRKTGPKGNKRDMVVSAITTALNNREVCLSELKAMSDKELMQRFNFAVSIGRTTYREARQLVTESAAKAHYGG